MAVDFELELMWIPVSDVDRAKSFYLEQAGFDLLVDIPNGLPGQRIVQVTPPGASCRSSTSATRTATCGCCKNAVAGPVRLRSWRGPPG
jgi:hypothetical protein